MEERDAGMHRGVSPVSCGQLEGASAVRGRWGWASRERGLWEVRGQCLGSDPEGGGHGALGTTGFGAFIHPGEVGSTNPGVTASALTPGLPTVNGVPGK